MTLAHFFIDHPRFAVVLNVFIVLGGLATMFTLPIAQYPHIVPPTIQVTALYQARIAIAKDQTDTNEHLLKLVQNRFAFARRRR